MKILLGSLLGLTLFVMNVTAELPSWETLADRARWAANAHNVQSWKLVAVPGRPDQRRLTLDPTRLLPETDPAHRQLTISLGAFLAVLKNEAGIRAAQITWEPLPSEEPGALVTLSPGPSLARPTEAMDALTAPTVKYKTAEFSLDPELRATQEARSTPTVRIHWLIDPTEVAMAKTWAQKGYDLEMDLPRTRDESLHYTHYGEATRKAKPWGITLLPNFRKDDLFWIETWAALFPQSPTEYAKSAKELMAGALGPVRQILVLTSRGNGVRERLETGETLQRLWLEVRAQGGELLPLSQGLQEFPEMGGFYTEAHRRWAREGETVQMVLALFRPAPGVFLPSPRIPAKAITD